MVQDGQDGASAHPHGDIHDGVGLTERSTSGLKHLSVVIVPRLCWGKRRRHFIAGIQLRRNKDVVTEHELRRNAKHRLCLWESDKHRSHDRGSLCAGLIESAV